MRSSSLRSRASLQVCISAALKRAMCLPFSARMFPSMQLLFMPSPLLAELACTVNPLYTEQEISHQLKDSGARFLVTVPPCLAKANAAAREANIEELFVFDKFDETADNANGATPFSSLLESDGEFPAPEIDPREDLVALPYSSGTTGLPKGVMLTHHNLVANMCQMEGLSYFTEDRYTDRRAADVSHLWARGHLEPGSAAGRHYCYASAF